MFTGIIKQKSKVIGTSDSLGIKKVFFSSLLQPLSLGESISINGVCSTVVELSEQGFAIEYMPETLKKTTMKGIVAGDSVNIERSLKAGDALDGHLVYGHIDTVGMVLKSKQEGNSKVLEISSSKEIEPCLVLKGSVALDGVSLTISHIAKKSFEVSLIPYTIEHTTLGGKKAGDLVNIEVDMLARYVQKLIKK